MCVVVGWVGCGWGEAGEGAAPAKGAALLPEIIKLQVGGWGVLRVLGWGVLRVLGWGGGGGLRTAASAG